ncbi:DUF3349 domain-containing protein [Frankia sp. AgB32]|uniref:DUF3349 domain-containing protein n=1 Tax=Frankia sp. AgB32 TaxID=631119 RepID=UPI00200D2EB4|nr:DUF3349 domain-containing protein [Frankia sp. AgB32]MCK9893359.1 DUF3349 domain-containing protein [Frankia sp. AgB32]
MTSRSLPPFLAAIIDWLRAGYPEGVPEHDYLPLFALLQRKLTAEEVDRIAETLSAGDDPASGLAIRGVILAVTDELPREDDIARVSARLAAGGWPLAEPSRAHPETP